MAEPLDRDSVIRLLDQLGSDQDAEVLAAARDLHAQINAAALRWDELLMPDGPLPADTVATIAATPESSESSPAAGANGNDGDTLTLIEQLLADPDRSEALREELEEYKTDIAEGEFDAKDHQYVRALYQRLTT
jgi:hypothetical protein